MMLGTSKMARFWQVLGVLFILLGLYTLVFDDGAQSIIYLGGGSAMVLLLGRANANSAGDE